MLTKSLSILCVSAVLVPLFIVDSKAAPQLPSTQVQAAVNPKPTQVPLQLTAPKTVQAPSSVQNGLVRAQFIAPTSGRLAYGFTQNEGFGKTYLALHSLAEQEETSHSYSLYLGQRLNSYYKNDEIFNPQFSPDGRQILFLFGSPDFSINGFLIYVLDVQSGKLTQVSSRVIRNDRVSWSPDGNYIAYMENGDALGGLVAGPQNWYLGPLTLWVCEWRSGKEYKVMENDTMRGPFTWRNAHNLVYGFLPDQDVIDRKTQPNIYEFSVEKAASRLMFKDGYRPVPSPNGKKIVFWGSYDTQKPSPLQGGWGDAPTGSYLSVANSDGSGRVSLNLGTSYPQVAWLLDSQSFLTLEQTQGDLHLEAQVRQWNMVDTSFRSVATVQAQGVEGHGIPLFDPDFRILSLSKDGKTLFISAVSSIPRVGTKLNVNINVSIYAVDIQTGSKSIIAKIENAKGLDWYESSLAPSQ